MPRHLFFDDPLAYRPGGSAGRPIRSGAGTVVALFLDAAATLPAIVTDDELGATGARSSVVVGVDDRLPDVYAANNVTVLYDASGHALYPRSGPRIETELAAFHAAPVPRPGQTATTFLDFVAVPLQTGGSTVDGQTKVIPYSMGPDGYVYGRNGSGANQLARFKSNLLAADMSLSANLNTAGLVGAGENVFAGFATEAGFLALLTNDIADTGRILFSPSWGTSGATWSVRKITRAMTREFVGKRATLPDGKTFLAFGEYFGGVQPPGGDPNNSATRALWATFDGGLTIQALHVLPALGAADVNNHWHDTAYDPIGDDIYVAHGDHANAAFLWADRADAQANGPAATWHTIAADGTPFTSGERTVAPQMPQPTVILPLDPAMVFAPDSGSVAPGLTAMTRRGSITEQATTFPVDLPGLVAYQQYGRPPYAVSASRRTAFVAFPPVASSGNAPDTFAILGTGDGGVSWHELYTRGPLGADQWLNGLVYDESGGWLYTYARVGGVSQVYRARQPGWGLRYA